MKKIFKYAVMACAVALGAMTFTSCGNDPETEPEPTPVNPDPINPDPEPDVQKTRLSSMTINTWSGTRQIEFTYDYSDRLSSITESGYDRMTVDFGWEPFSITYAGYPYGAGILVPTLSSQGYMTSVYDKENSWSKTTYEYDKSGHLVKIKAEGEMGNAVISLTWSAGLLTLVENKWVLGENSQIDTYKITYGNIDNTSGIWPYGFVRCGALKADKQALFEVPCLFQTGLLGIAPSKLPMRIMENEDESEYVRVRHELSYTLNDKGYMYEETMTSGYIINGSYEAEEPDKILYDYM